MRPRQQVFVNEMLQHGDNVKAYLAAYPKCKKSSARNAANRLLQNPEIQQAIDGPQQRLRKEIEAELRQKLEAEILCELQIKLLLSRIATGQLETDKLVRMKDGSYDTIKVKPNHNHILRALYMLSRMMGIAVPVIARSAAPAATKQSREMSDGASRDCFVVPPRNDAMGIEQQKTTNDNNSVAAVSSDQARDFLCSNTLIQSIEQTTSEASGDFSLVCTSFEMTGAIEQQRAINSSVPDIASSAAPAATTQFCEMSADVLSRDCFVVPPRNDFFSEEEQQKTTNLDLTGYTRLRDVWTEAWETNHYKQDAASYRHYRNIDWLSQSANFPAEQRQIIEIEAGWEFHPANSGWIRKRTMRGVNEKSPAEQGFNMNELC